MCVGVMKLCRIAEKLNANRMKFKCGSARLTVALRGNVTALTHIIQHKFDLSNCKGVTF